jgi:hypothetical protein
MWYTVIVHCLMFGWRDRVYVELLDIDKFKIGFKNRFDVKNNKLWQ